MGRRTIRRIAPERARVRWLHAQRINTVLIWGVILHFLYSTGPCMYAAASG